MAATNFGCSLCSAVISPELQSLLASNPPAHWWGVKFNLRSGIRSTNYTRTQREGTYTLVRLSTLSATTAAHPNFRPCHVPSEQFGAALGNRELESRTLAASSCAIFLIEANRFHRRQQVEPADGRQAGEHRSINSITLLH